jgi:glycine/D-amino acid oxidase-like deaminating enzyme
LVNSWIDDSIQDWFTNSPNRRLTNSDKRYRDMPRLRLGTPLWLARRRGRATRFPTLRSRISADIAVVGGGITGATVAWRFADAGFKVALLDANAAGRGSTAASTALLMQETDEDYAGLADRYGEKRTRRIWELSRMATREFVGAIGRLGIRCHLGERDSVYYALTADDAGKLRDEYRRRRTAGIDGRWLGRAALLNQTGIDGAAAIRTSGNAQVDPYEACVGFLRAAARRGAMIFDRSRVNRIVRARHHVTVITDRGSVQADQVVIATGYATPYFKPLAGRFRMMNTYVVTTRPLNVSERRRLGLDQVMLWDMERPYHYARWTDDHRLMLGGADRPQLPDRRRAPALRDCAQSVLEHFTALYPALADVDAEYAWEGLFAATRDGLPYIGPHRRYPRHLFALGYGGNGMTFGFLAATLLLDWYRGKRTSDHDLFSFSRVR